MLAVTLNYFKKGKLPSAGVVDKLKPGVPVEAGVDARPPPSLKPPGAAPADGAAPKLKPPPPRDGALDVVVVAAGVLKLKVHKFRNVTKPISLRFLYQIVLMPCTFKLYPTGQHERTD